MSDDDAEPKDFAEEILDGLIEGGMPAVGVFAVVLVSGPDGSIGAVTALADRPLSASLRVAVAFQAMALEIHADAQRRIKSFAERVGMVPMRTPSPGKPS